MVIIMGTGEGVRWWCNVKCHSVKRRRRVREPLLLEDFHKLHTDYHLYIFFLYLIKGHLSGGWQLVQRVRSYVPLL